MASDATTGTVVLFGGDSSSRVLGQTWTWDGTSWTQQQPAIHPRARQLASMTYDAATGTVILFGGETPRQVIVSDTWAWG
jgi:hypothetical protein